MSRKRLFEKEVQGALAALKSGTPSYQIQRRYVVSSFIKDLVEINRLVPSLGSINKNIIVEVVKHWKRKGNNAKTIQRKLSVVKTVIRTAKPNFTMPTNSELGNNNFDFKKKQSINQSILPNFIENDHVNVICNLQYLFGLKKFEALEIEPYMFLDDRLHIPRHVAYNNYDRYIPILTNDQKDFVANIISSNKSQNIFKPDTLSLMHRDCLLKFGITNEDHFRYLYIINRHDKLLQHMTQIQALSVLREELGYKDNRPLYEIIQCQNVA